MNPTAILSLIGSLWQQLAEAQARVAQLEAELSEAREGGSDVA